jgi:hypothetical protein
MNEPRCNHDWHEADQYGTLKCRKCGVWETQLPEYGAEPVAPEPPSQFNSGMSGYVRAKAPEPEPSQPSRAFMSAEGMRPIRPIGKMIIDHPKLEEWLKTGQARQLHDGLWLHYAVICTLLTEAYKEAALDHERVDARKLP